MIQRFTIRPRDILQPLVTTLVLIALSTVFTVPGYALPDDREQPIHISADKAVRDEKQGVTIYSGNVQMRQGSMELDADSLTIYHEAKDANKIVARGTPAKMRQQPEIDEGLVHAHAESITYFRNEELVHLRTNAELTRDDGTLVTGNSIDYFITRELVKAESDGNDKDNKVFVVIPPALLTDQDKSGQDGASTSSASEKNSDPASSAVTVSSSPEADSDESPAEP